MQSSDFVPASSALCDVLPVADLCAANPGRYAATGDGEIEIEPESSGAIAPEFADANAIESCQPVSGFVEEDQWQDYAITVPAGTAQLEVELTGPEGDVDLYVRKNELPTLAGYDFRPWLDNSNEQVVVDADATTPLSPGVWYVSVNGFIAGEYALSVAVDECEL